MNDEMKIKFKVDLRVPVESDDPKNEWNLIMHDRMTYVKNPGATVTDRRYHLFFLKDPTLWIRDFNTDKSTLTKRPDGVYSLVTPPDFSDPEFKQMTTFVLHPGVMVGNFHYALDRQRKPALELITITGRALKNVLARYAEADGNSKAVEYDWEGFHNDILIDGKKIGGIQAVSNNTGIYQQVGFTWRYEDEFFRKVLPKDQFERLTSQHGKGAGISGISNEFPNVTRDEFLADYQAEIERLLPECYNL